MAFIDKFIENKDYFRLQAKLQVILISALDGRERSH
jgi:hypothetical protein